MKAAIYARKSTDDNEKAAQDKSVERQVAHAREFIARKGWSLDGEHIYVDDGISGAEFKNRPALLKMLDTLREFNVIVMSEQSRLGREMSQTSATLAKITARKVRVFFYLNEQELHFQSATDKFMVNAVSFANELERELASQRARDAALKRAKEGRNFGGRVYGYDNIWVLSNGTQAEAPPGTKKAPDAQTIYRINEREAAVVRGIYQMSADGHGHGTIARTLNAFHGNAWQAPKPDKHRLSDKAIRNSSDIAKTVSRLAALNRQYFGGTTPPTPAKGTGSWSPASILAILHRVRYTGVVPFGKARKIVDNAEGTKKREHGELLLTPRPELRILPEELWAAVQERQATARKTYLRDTGGKLWGNPGRGAESKYLLTGIAKCGCCNASITNLGGRAGGPGSAHRAPLFYYGCSWRRNRGRNVCANDVSARMQDTDEAVLVAVEQQALFPKAIVFTIEEALRLIAEKRRERPDRPREIEAELKRLRRELDRFMALIANGRAPESILLQIAERETRIQALDRELSELQAGPVDELDTRRLRRAVEERIGRFRALLRADVPLARQALGKLIVPDSLRFTPATVGGRRTFAFEGKTRIGPLFDPRYIEMASPRGFEPLSPP